MAVARVVRRRCDKPRRRRIPGYPPYNMLSARAGRVVQTDAYYPV